MFCSKIKIIQLCFFTKFVKSPCMSFPVLAKARAALDPDLQHGNRNKAQNVDHTVS